MSGRRQDSKRASFFQEGADSLTALGLLPTPNRYVCPQCVRAFIPEAVPARVLTLEHVPSRRVGGKQITLTCDEYNPTAGTRLDAAVADERRFEDFVRGAPGRWRGRLITDDARGVAVTIERDKDRAEVVGSLRKSHPDAHRATFEYFERHVGRSDWQFKIHIRGFNARLAMIGHLRTAYLAAFAKFGYTTILNPLGRQIREQIAAPDKEVIKGFLATTTAPIDPSVRVMAICQQPFPFLAAQMGHRIIVLPWPPSSVDPYAALQQTDITTANMQGAMVEWPRGMELLLDKQTVAQRGPVKP